MKTGMKQVVCLLLALCVLGCLIFPTFAIEEECFVEESRVWIPSEPLPSSGELYDGYVEQMFYGDSISTYGILAREHLNPLGRTLYDFLKEKIEQVASGTTTSTVFDIDMNTLSSWGVQVAYDTTDTDAALVKLLAQLDTENVLTALLHDCPYELYWFDKVCGLFQTAGFSMSEQSCTVAFLTFGFWVTEDCQPADYDFYNPSVDAGNVNQAKLAADKAKSIVKSHKDKTDYEKLCAYKDAICDLVSYDYSAAYGGYFSENGAPWQLVHVFDGDTKTNVVCEGYSKAFKYLCDMTEFAGSVECYIATGAFAAYDDSELHMWNIVSVEDNHYLVDVTNSESGAVGDDGSLFMVGGTGSPAKGYRISDTYYTYDYESQALWGTDADSILSLASKDYDPDTLAPVKHNYTASITLPTCTEKGFTTYTCTLCGDSYVDTYVSATGHDYRTTVTAPSCTEQGYTTYVCTRCDDIYTDDYVSVLGHSGGTATCKDKAVCDRCGAAYGELDAANHAGGTEVKNVKAETCVESGYTGDTHCVGCGAKLSSGEIINPDGHNYVCSVISVPSKIKTGKMIAVCEACGDTSTEILPKLSEADYTYSVVEKPTAATEGIGRYTWKVSNYGEIWFEVKLDKLSSARGDINGDGYVNDEDVILLLWHTLLPDLYPIDADGDINGDGSVNDEDVILLLWHTLLPDLYPI